MDVFLLILTILVWVKYILIIAMNPMPSPMSRFELERRAKASKRAKGELRREQSLGSILLLQRLAGSIILIAGVSLSVIYAGWLGGILVSILVVALGAVAAKQRLVARLAEDIYKRFEPTLIKIVSKGDIIFRYVGVSGIHDSDRYRRLDSREDLLHLIESSNSVLTESQRKVISSTLVFGDKRVDHVMTPASSINSIKKDEFLGPLVLSELHDLGHSRLPVIDGDIDHVVGILYLRDLLSLDVRRSVTAEKAMDKKVYYIHQDDTLDHALAAFLKVRHHLFIVINDERETVGLLSLEDVIETLIGQKIVDEDDHDDASKVASSRKNNRPAGHVDV